jgi:histone H3/H4
MTTEDGIKIKAIEESIKAALTKKFAGRKMSKVLLAQMKDHLEEVMLKNTSEDTYILPTHKGRVVHVDIPRKAGESDEDYLARLRGLVKTEGFDAEL